jgi:hypothetical protein
MARETASWWRAAASSTIGDALLAVTDTGGFGNLDVTAGNHRRRVRLLRGERHFTEARPDKPRHLGKMHRIVVDVFRGVFRHADIHQVERAQRQRNTGEDDANAPGMQKQLFFDGQCKRIIEIDATSQQVTLPDIARGIFPVGWRRSYRRDLRTRVC